MDPEIRPAGTLQAPVPARMAPDPIELERAADIFSSSQRPVIVTSRIGRNPAAVPALVELSELLGAFVVDRRRERMNFPTTHPAYLADDADSKLAIGNADVIFAIDCLVPWVPLQGNPAEGAKVIIADVDPLRLSIPDWSFPADVMLQANPELCVRQLCNILRRRSSKFPVPSWPEGRTRLKIETQPKTDIRGVDPELPMNPFTVIEALNSLLGDTDIVVEESTTNASVLRKVLKRTIPGTLFHSGGSGLGWALGAALGAKLAAPNQRVIAVVGDGSFMFSSPTAALWASKAAGSPFLVLILENGGYAGSHKPVINLFPQGFSQEANFVPGTRFDDPPDYAGIARACGAAGERVDDPRELVPVLQRSLATVDAGRSAVVVASVSTPWLQ